MATHLFVESFLQDIGDVHDQSRKSMDASHPKLAAPRWIPPPAGQCKTNVDATVPKTTNHEAMVFEGITDLRSLEAIAFCEALALAGDLQIGDMMIATDCMEVVQGLREKNLGRFSNILRDRLGRKYKRRSACPS
jgi:hypothetical protein